MYIGNTELLKSQNRLDVILWFDKVLTDLNLTRFQYIAVFEEFVGCDQTHPLTCEAENKKH